MRIVETGHKSPGKVPAIVEEYFFISGKTILLNPMFLKVVKSKIHRAVVAEANLNYVGSKSRTIFPDQHNKIKF